MLIVINIVYNKDKTNLVGKINLVCMMTSLVFACLIFN